MNIPKNKIFDCLLKMSNYRDDKPLCFLNPLDATFDHKLCRCFPEGSDDALLFGAILMEDLPNGSEEVLDRGTP